jgi:hypothetical protein
MTAATATPEPARFGRLLTWRPCADGRDAWHAGRRHVMTRLTRRRADELGTRPGWHLLSHRDSPEASAAGIGPALGDRVSAATEAAELWILTAPGDHWPVNAIPSVRLVYAPGGAGFRTLTGTILTASARPDGIIAIHATGSAGQRDLVATVCPVASGVETITLDWHLQLADGTRLEPRASWQGAARTIAVQAP